MRQSLFFNKVACNFIKKEALAQVFFCEFCEIFKNTFSYRTPPVVTLFIWSNTWEVRTLNILSFQQRRIQDSHKDRAHGNNSQRLLAVKYCCKTLHIRCLQCNHGQNICRLQPVLVEFPVTIRSLSPKGECKSCLMSWQTTLPFKRQPHKMVKHTQIIRQLLRTNSLSVFDHFVGLALKGLRLRILGNKKISKKSLENLELMTNSQSANQKAKFRQLCQKIAKNLL